MDLTARYLIPLQPVDVDDPDLLSAAETFANEVEATLLDFEAERQRIRRDRGLTDEPEGRPARIHAAAQKAAQQLQLLAEVRIPKLQKAVEQGGAYLSETYRHRLPETVNADDWRASEREARERLAEMDDFKRETLYLEAARRGDRQTVRAVELAPNAFPLVSDGTKAKAAELFAAATWPKEWRLREQQQNTLTTMQFALNTGATALGKMVRQPLEDPVAAMASAATDDN